MKRNKAYKVDTNGKFYNVDWGIFQDDTTPGNFDGEGSKENPYIIMSIEDLCYFSMQSNNGENYSNKYIILGKNLDFKSELSYCNSSTTLYNEYFEVSDKNISLFEILTNEKYNGFKPINRFSGYFSGEGYSISNVYINDSNDTGGLVRYLDGKIEKITLNGNIKGNGYVGGIAGIGKGEIQECNWNGKIENISQQENYQGTGGILGGSTGSLSINKCISNGNISSLRNTGGILGYNVSGDNVIDSCVNNASINSQKGSSGGIVGINGDKIINSYNTGNIISEGQDGSAGGIAGYNCNNIINCYNSGTINGGVAGGIVGYFYFRTSSIINSYNCGDVKMHSNKNGGIIIGNIYSISTNVSLINSYGCTNSIDAILINSGAEHAEGNFFQISNENLHSHENDGLLEKLNDYVEKNNNENKLIYWNFGKEDIPTLDIK